MTDAVAGFRALLSISTSTGGSLVPIVELKDYNINVTSNVIDVTNHDSSGHREVITGIDQWEGGGTVNYVIDSSGQIALYAVLTAKTLVDFEFYPTGSSSEGYFSGSGFVTGFNLTAPMGDAVGAALTFTGNSLFAFSSAT